MMNKFGVCRYDMNGYEPKVTDLKRFDDYQTAYDDYMQQLASECKSTFRIPEDLWLVFIDDERGCIVQFERFDTLSKCRIVKLPE